jgi:hypothetical protein
MTDFIETPDLVFIAAGLLILAIGCIPLGWLERRHSVKLHERLQRGDDRYHEELRALQAYNPKHRRLIFLGLGAILLSVGLQGWLNH